MPHNSDPSPRNPDQGWFDVLPPDEGLELQNEQFRVPEYFKQASRPAGERAETKTSQEYALEVLDLFAEQNKHEGHGMSLSKRLKTAVNRDEIARLEQESRHAAHAVQRSEIEAKETFGKAVGIDTRVDIFKGPTGKTRPIVKAVNSPRQRELDVRYNRFREMYGGRGEDNKKRRDAVRNGKQEAIIPGYVPLDRAIDHVMSDVRLEPAVSETEEHRYLERADLIEQQAKLTAFHDALTVFGKRNQKIFHDGKFEQKTSSGKIPKLDEINLPARAVNENLSSYCRRLSPNEMAKLASELFEAANGFEAVRSSGLLTEKESKDTEDGDFKLFWMLYSKRGEDVSEDRADLKQAIRAKVHELEQISASAGDQLSMHIA